MTLSLYPIVFWLYVQNLSNNHPNLPPDLNLFFSKDYNKKVKSSAKRIIECPFRQMSTSICAYNFPIWSNAMRRVIAEGMTPFCGKTDANGQKWCLAQNFPHFENPPSCHVILQKDFSWLWYNKAIWSLPQWHCKNVQNSCFSWYLLKFLITLLSKWDYWLYSSQN